MTVTEDEIWQRWNQLHHNTAQIAKTLGIPEHEVDRILHRLKRGRTK